MTVPGWYPDPQNAHAEIYWDGSSWCGRRPKQYGAPPVPGPSSGHGLLYGHPPAYRRRQGMDPRIKASILIASLIALPALVAFIVYAASESPYQDECERAAAAEGYRGGELDQAVEFCVQYQEEFAGP